MCIGFEPASAGIAAVAGALVVAGSLVASDLTGVWAKDAAATVESSAASKSDLVVVMVNSDSNEIRFCSDSLERVQHLSGLGKQRRVYPGR